MEQALSFEESVKSKSPRSSIINPDANFNLSDAQMEFEEPKQSKGPGKPPDSSSAFKSVLDMMNTKKEKSKKKEPFRNVTPDLKYEFLNNHTPIKR